MSNWGTTITMREKCALRLSKQSFEACIDFAYNTEGVPSTSHGRDAFSLSFLSSYDTNRSLPLLRGFVEMPG